MKINLFTQLTRLKGMNKYTCFLLPAIAIKRDDIFADEAAHYVYFQWLFFQVYVRVITKKKINP